MGQPRSAGSVSRLGLWWSRRPASYGIAGDNVARGTEMRILGHGQGGEGPWEPGNAYGALRA